MLAHTSCSSNAVGRSAATAHITPSGGIAGGAKEKGSLVRALSFQAASAEVLLRFSVEMAQLVEERHPNLLPQLALVSSEARQVPSVDHDAPAGGAVHRQTGLAVGWAPE